MYSFLQRCSPRREQYDVEPEDVIYLSYHVQSCNDIEDFTDIDIKQILCPLDLNPFTKYPTRQTFYKQSTYPEQTNYTTTQYKTQAANFLGKTYQKLYDRPIPKTSDLRKQNKVQSTAQVDKYSIINTNRPYDKNLLNENNNYGALYIDNFTRSAANTNLHLDHLLGNQMLGRSKYEVFQDDLNSNSSSVSRMSKESAFDRS